MDYFTSRVQFTITPTGDASVGVTTGDRSRKRSPTGSY